MRSSKRRQLSHFVQFEIFLKYVLSARRDYCAIRLSLLGTNAYRKRNVHWSVIPKKRLILGDQIIPTPKLHFDQNVQNVPIVCSSAKAFAQLVLGGYPPGVYLNQIRGQNKRRGVTWITSAPL